MNKSPWRFLLITCLLITSVMPAVNAALYPGYNLQKILLKQEGTAGQKNHSLDIRYLDSILQGIALHAGNYPPKFDSDDDRQHAILDIKMLTTMLNMALTDDNNPNPELLIRAATANRMAHNLDISGAADKASQQYQQLIRIDPENPSANFQHTNKKTYSHLAKAYLFYLSTLINMSDFKPETGWRHLLYKPDYNARQ